MKLTQPSLDIGLRTDKLNAMLSFWQQDVGLPFKEVMAIREGQAQHRHDANGSVLKINAHDQLLERHPPAGYRSIVIAKSNLSAPRRLIDPEGTEVTLAPAGYEGVDQVGVRMGVRNLDAHRRFYAEAVGLPELAPGVFAAGRSRIFLEADKNAPESAEMQGPGFRYITFVVADGVGTHKHLIAHGAQPALGPIMVNRASVVSLSMVRDLDGNWIEILERG